MIKMRAVFMMGMVTLFAAVGSVTPELASSHREAPAGSITERSFWIPQFGHGSTAGNQFTTAINLINLSTTTSKVAIFTFGDDGNPLNLLDMDGTSVSKIEDLEIQGRGTASINSLNEDPTNQLGLGYAQVTTQQAIGVEVIFEIRDPENNLSATNVRPIPLVTALSFFGRASADTRTGIAVVNPPTNKQTTVEFFLFDSPGTPSGNGDVVLAPGQKSAQFLDQLVENLGGFTGSVEMRSDEPVSLLPLRQQGLVLTTQDAFPPRQLD